MRPEQNAQYVLSTTRAKAKMYEYDVPLEEHIRLATPPAILFSLAVGLLGDAAAAIASDNPEDARRLTPSEALVFSATFFDAYIATRLDGAESEELPILASAAYYLADNPGSAKVVIDRAPPPSVALASGLGLLVYKLLKGDFEPLPAGARYANFGTMILASLATYMRAEGESEPVITTIEELRTLAYDVGDGRLLFYADVVAAISRRKISNAARTILPQTSGLGVDVWSDALRRQAFPRELWPAQRRICAAGVLAGKSAVIQMPTSAGKTRASELLLRSAFLANRTSLAVVVCPFRALCHDVRGELTKAFAGENISLNEATDSYEMDLSIEELLEQRTVLIVTPEKLLYMLRRNPELASEIGLIVYDEGHQFDSAARGPTYELLLTSLKLSMPADAQVVLISAVISNAAKLADWLLGAQGAVVHGDGLAPTQKSIAFASWFDRLGRMEYVRPSDPNDREFFVPRVIESTILGRLGRERRDRIFPIKDSGVSVGLYLGLKLARQGGIAIFCGRKDTAANVCEDAVDLFLRGAPFAAPSEISDADEVGRLASLFQLHLGAAAAATGSARLGIFPHHANVPHGLRLAVEHAMKEGLIRFVVCTSTLAQGVNLPIRYLIVTGVYQGADRIMVRDFHNLIGRAGRAGMHTEGSIIFAETAVYDQRRNYNLSWKWRAARELLDPRNTEPCESAILSIFQPFSYGPRQQPKTITVNVGALHGLVFNEAQTLQGAVENIRGQDPELDVRGFERFVRDRARIVQGIATFLLAHLNFEAEDWQDQAAALARNTFAFYSADDDQKPEIESLFRNVAESLRAGAATEEIRTNLRRSPMPPASVSELRGWINQNLPALRQAVAANGLFALIAPIMLIHNQNSSVTSLSESAIAAEVAQLWIDGSSFEEIYALLGERDIRIGGNNRSPKVEDAVAICESGLGYDGAMIVATMADLAEEDDDDVHNALALLQKRLKYGLPNKASIAFFELGFADRVVAVSLAEAFPDVPSRGFARLELRRQRERARQVLARFPTYFMSVFGELTA